MNKIINLEADEMTDIQWENNTHKHDVINLEVSSENMETTRINDGNFIQKRHQRRSTKKRLGNGLVSEEQKHNGFSGEDRKVWLYINRVKRHVTTDMIVEFIKKRNRLKMKR